MPWNLAVLMGGPSPERPISLQTGAAMAEALRARGHAVVEHDLHRGTFAALQEQRPDCVVLALHGVPGEDGSVQAVLDLLGIPY
ncbi:MAG TPA: D-alanine--D-alanine ligase, partial [bacterium]|nr:D-alanine--D-alanine ligase [bacterium]